MIFEFLRKRGSALVAKNRLNIAIMSDRGGGKNYPFMEELKIEILSVVKKYMCVRGIEVKKEIDGKFEAISIDVFLDSRS
jgi:cell division topological specificity factor MinE